MSSPGSVGTELLFENDFVRVWEICLESGEATHWHRHMHDHVRTFVTEHNAIEITKDPGRVPNSAVFAQGFTEARRVEDRGMPAQRLRNLGDGLHRQVVVEILGRTGAGSPSAEPESNNGRIQTTAHDSEFW